MPSRTMWSVLAFFLLLVAATSPALPVKTDLHYFGPGSLPNVHDIVQSSNAPNSLYAASGVRKYSQDFTTDTMKSRVFTSGDSGRTWEPLALIPDAVPFDVNAVAVSSSNGDTLFAGTTRGGVWRSSDAGQNWVRVTAGGQYGEVSRIYCPASRPGKVYVGMGLQSSYGPLKRDEVVLVSRNDGDTWTTATFAQSWTSPCGVIAEALWFDPAQPSRILLGMHGYSAGGVAPGGLWESLDDGASFSKTSAFPFGGGQARPVHGLAAKPGAPGEIWACTQSATPTTASVPLTDLIYRSTDAGVSWTTGTGSFLGGESGSALAGLAFDPTAPSTVWALRGNPSRTGSGFKFPPSPAWSLPNTQWLDDLSPLGYRSVNGGDTWTTIPLLDAQSRTGWPPSGPLANGFCLHPVADPAGTRLLLGSLSRGMVSVAGDQIQSAQTGYPESSVTQVAVTHDAGGKGSLIAMFRLPDSRYATEYPAGAFACHDSMECLGMDGTGAETWTAVSARLVMSASYLRLYAPKIAVHPVQRQTAISGDTYPRVTRDGGKSWLPAWDVRVGFGTGCMAFSPHAPFEFHQFGLYVSGGTFVRGLRRTPDLGATWELLDPSLSGYSITSIAWCGNPSVIVLCAGGNGVLFSFNDGASFAARNSGLPGYAGATSTGALVTAIAGDPSGDSVFYAATELGICRTTNAGLTWEAPSTQGAALTRASKLWVHPGDVRQVLACCSQGLFITSDGGRLMGARRHQPGADRGERL